jgi:hypothetical protein
VDKHFNPIYSRKVVESLIDKAGGRIKSVQKFHRSKDESLAYHRLLLNLPVDSDGNPILPKEPEMVSRRCCLIPVDKAIDFISSWRSPFPPDDPPDDGGDTPGNGGGGNTPNPTPNCGSSDDLTEPVTSVTSGYTSVTQKCNQQNLDSEGISDNSDSPVTFLEEEVVNYLAFSDDETISTSLPGSTDGQDEQLEQLGHTFISLHDVTRVVEEAETEIEVESQRLHSRCNLEVTDVTECNHNARVVDDKQSELAQAQKAAASGVSHTSSDLVKELDTQEFKEGDRVIWDDCPGHCSWLNPLTIVSIEGGFALLEFYRHPVPLSELRKVPL